MTRRSLVALMFSVMGAAALLHVWVHLQVITVGYDLSRENRWRHDLSELNQRLQLELRTRTDLLVIEKAAREKLKMVPPEASAIRVLQVPPNLVALDGNHDPRR